MSVNRSFQVSEEFLIKFEEIKKYYKNDLQIKYSNEEILNEMIDIYYATIFLQSNSAIARLVKNQVESSLEQFSKMTAQFHNVVIDEIKKIDK